MLEIRNVTKRFGEVVALDGVTLSVEAGQSVGFLGPNGAGKSTTMRAVMGLISTDAGTITWKGEPLTAALRHRFGYMPAERGMYPKMTVRDQLVYFARLAGLSTSAAVAAAAKWMVRVDIIERAGDEVQALSSGNQQRVQLAIALVHDPDVLILDEPFSGLDPLAVENMKMILSEQIEAGKAVLFSSHQLDLVSDVSRDVVIINSGKVIMAGDVTELRERSESRNAVVGFAEPTAWIPSMEGVEVVEHRPRSVRLRVPAGTEPAALLGDAERAGRVVDFSFTAPDLSEVFLGAIAEQHRDAVGVSS